VNITTQHGDTGRTGLNASETILTTANVNQTTFGKLFEKGVDGDMYPQPLYLQGVSIGGGTHNVVYCATANNSIYAFDADNGGVAAYWSRNLGTAVPQGDVDCCCTDVATVVGIMSTGVIDTSTNTWYVVHKQKNTDSTYHQFLHAIDVTSGAEKFSGPKEISATNSGVSFDAKLNNQRCGLLLQGGNVYIAWSSHNDCGAYHGWVMGYSASTLTQVATFPVTVSGGSMAGVWMAGGGLVGDGTNIYFMTGNGTFDANTGGNNLGESFVKLNSSLVRQDFFTPFDQASLNSSDRDLGGGGVVLIPGANRLVGGGKGGKWYLVNTASADACLQSFMVTDTTDSLNHLHGTPSYFNGSVYVGGESDQLKQFSWNGTSLGTTPTTQTSFETVTNSMPGWQHCISANGTSNAIIWAARVFSGDANHTTQPGIVHAFDATNLANELWNSNQNSGRDNVGNFAKNPGPIVANGKVYVPTFSNKLVVYGLLGSSTSNGTGLTGNYFNNQTLTGSPTVVRTDSQVNFNWGTGSPDPNIPVDHFSVRWTGFVQATVSGNYTFSTISDDGIRLWVNGNQIINDWTDHAQTTDNSGAVGLTAGQLYPVTLEYYENGGGAIAELLWTPPGGSQAAIPQSQLYPSGNGLTGTYFNNQTLSGVPTLTRIDGTVNFNWGTGSPDPSIGVDHFSARWTGTVVPLVSGNYTFSSDDGVRLSVNGSQIINDFTDHAQTTDTSGAVALTAGVPYTILMEYYENGGQAVAELAWTPPGGSLTTIPQSQMYSGGTGLTGNYFNNQTLTSPATLVRIDPTVNFNWDVGSPDPSIPADHFSVRWTGTVRATVTGNYTFATTSDDGIRLSVGGVQVINDFTDHGPTTDTSGAVALNGGQFYTVTLEFYEDTGGAEAILMWTPPGGGQSAIPQSALYPQ
jgi:hypothetical protein